MSLIALAALLLLVFGGGAHLGMFSGSTLELAERQEIYVVGLAMTGSYSRANRKVSAELLPLLDQRGVAHADLPRATVIYDYPWDVRKRERRSLAGVAMSQTPAPSVLADPVRLETIASQTVLVASTEAHPSIAAFKLFPKIRAWLQKQNYTEAGPAVEVISPDGVVEIRVPVSPVAP